MMMVSTFDTSFRWTSDSCLQAGDGSPAQAKALGALDQQVSSSLEKIRTQLASEFAPRMTFEETIAVLKKRIIDVEWKMMRRKAEV